MDPPKVSVVTSWLVPETRKQIQGFMGLARFIRYFGVAASLTALTSSQFPFKWSPMVDKAFQALKTQFTSAPVFQLPDSE